MKFSSRLTQSNAKSQAGLTLIETLVSLAIFALVVGGALALFGSASSSQTTTQMTSDLTSIRSSTKQLFFGQGGYGSGALNAVLVNSDKIPATMTVSTATPPVITHSQSGTVSVAGIANTNTFTITTTLISKAVCIGLVGTPGWTSVKVNALAAMIPATTPITPVIASTNCAADTNTIVFTSV